MDYKLEDTKINIAFKDGETPPPSLVTISCDGGGLLIHAPDEDRLIAYLETYEGKTRLAVFNDIESEEPTEVIEINLAG